MILQDIVMHREEFNKKFLTESIEGFDIDTIVADGYRAYNSIIEELGLKHQVCVFHKMKNLMDETTPIHNSLRSKIRNLKKEISKLEELKAKYKGIMEKPKNDDIEGKNNIPVKKDLNEKITRKKRELRKYEKELDLMEK